MSTHVCEVNSSCGHHITPGLVGLEEGNKFFLCAFHFHTRTYGVDWCGLIKGRGSSQWVMKHQKQGRVLYVSARQRLGHTTYTCQGAGEILLLTGGWVRIDRGATLFSGMSILGVYKYK